MRISLVALLCFCFSVFAAPKQDRKQDKFDKMTHAELFEWAMNTPVENKPWRIVARIEMSQKDPVEWGWNVNSELETAIFKKYPNCDGITYWQAKVWCDDYSGQIKPGSVSVTIWHLRITDGELGVVSSKDW